MGTAERHDPSSLDATGLAAAIADGQITASQAMREALGGSPRVIPTSTRSADCGKTWA